MTRSLGFALVFIAAVSTSFAACSSDDTSSSGAPLAAACSINSDCADPLVCAFRKCHVQCTTSRDCATGQRCMASDRPFHVCQLPDEQPCSFNSDCPAGQLCASDRQCRDQCAADRDCVSGQLCVAGTCAEPAELDGGKLPSAPDASVVGQTCAYTSECGDDYVCRAGRCQYECIDGRDCASGQTCQEHRCTGRTCGGGDAGVAVQAGAVCSYTSECPSGLVCRAHRCDCECLAAPDCAPGQTCQDNHCVTGGSGPDGGTEGGADGGVLPPGVLASKQGTVNGLMVMGTTAFWTTSSGRLASCSVFGCNDQPTLLAQGLTAPGAIATDGYRVFVATGGSGANGQIHRFDLPPNLYDTVMATGLPGVGPIAVRSSSFCFATRGTAPSYLDGGIFRCNVDDCAGAPETVATGDLDARSLAVSASNVYFTKGDGTVWTVPSVPGNSGTPAQFATVSSAANSVAVDEAQVYFTTKSGDVYACPLGDTCPSPTLLGNGAPDGQQIASDDHRVFWIALGDASNGFHDGVFTCDVTGCNGPPTELATDPIGLPIALDPARVFFSADGNVRVLDKTTCPTGLGDCDGDPANGCEAQLVTSLSDCGACLRGCSDQNATATCGAGVCSLACEVGFADCNLDGADGCEAALDSDPFNCGGCGVVCGTQNAEFASCYMGACSIACFQGFDDCNADPGDGCETDTTTDSKNCGKCGLDCLGGACAAGLCTPVTLATWPDTVSGLTTDDAAAYVSLAGTGASDGTVMSVDWAGTKKTLATGLVNPGPLLIANGKLYALLAGLAPSVEASVLALDPKGLTPPTTVATLKGLYNARRFALDTDDVTAYVGNELYLAAPTIVRVALPTGTVATVPSDYGNGPLAAFNGDLFYQLNGSLAVLLAGGSGMSDPGVLADGPSLVVRTQGPSNRLFFASTDGGISFTALPYTPNNPTMSVALDTIAMALTADRATPFEVYWVDAQGDVRRQQPGGTILATGQTATQLIDVTSDRVVWVNDKTTTFVAKMSGVP